MLAIISDLHFCDGTATEKNVSAKAFALALGEIYELAAESARKLDRPVHLDLVLLGDVIDLLRTERWFEDRDGVPVPLAERPWASERALDRALAPPPVIARANAIFDDILRENEEQLRILRGETAPPPPGVVVRRIYVPGNHDRLSFHDEALATRLRVALGAVDPVGLGAEGIYLHRLEMPRYGLLARHGHEWDIWNFESLEEGAAPSEYTPADYLPTPIGDAIATELVSRLPYEIKRRLADSRRITPQEREHIYRRMQRIEDVRPLLASFQWACYEADRLGGALGSAAADELRAITVSAVKELADGFRKLDYFQAWAAKHGRLLPIGPADALKAALRGLSLVGVDRLLGVAMRLDGRLGEHQAHDACRIGAGMEDLRSVGTRGLRFVAYGHTHSPLEVALSVQEGTNDIYLNSGTFRRAVFRSDDRKGFIGWERLTYLCFFAEEEVDSKTPRSGPAFLTWTGARAE